jgi:hypothetical protein
MVSSIELIRACPFFEVEIKGGLLLRVTDKLLRVPGGNQIPYLIEGTHIRFQQRAAASTIKVRPSRLIGQWRWPCAVRRRIRLPSINGAIPCPQPNHMHVIFRLRPAPLHTLTSKLKTGEEMFSPNLRKEYLERGRLWAASLSWLVSLAALPHSKQSIGFTGGLGGAWLSACAVAFSGLSTE